MSQNQILDSVAEFAPYKISPQKFLQRYNSLWSIHDPILTLPQCFRISKTKALPISQLDCCYTANGTKICKISFLLLSQHLLQWVVCSTLEASRPQYAGRLADDQLRLAVMKEIEFPDRIHDYYLGYYKWCFYELVGISFDIYIFLSNYSPIQSYA